MGVRSAALAWALVACCLVLTVLGVAYAVTARDPRGWFGLIGLASAGWYVAAIRWVETHSTWS